MTPSRIRALLATDRIVGARKVGRDWIIPSPVVVTEGKRGPRMQAKNLK